MEFFNLILIFFTGIFFQKGQETYAKPMNKISIEELKVLGYEISNGTKDNTLKNEVPCSKNDDCHNGGICSEDRQCFCVMGYKGKNCEIIIGCDELNCNPEISDCILNEETGEGMCQCKENGKLYSEHKCMGSCREDSDCYNGGICTSDKTCMCRIGSAGDQCEIIEGCKELKCDPYISDCMFNVSTEKGMCKCKEEAKVFVNETCVDSCKEDSECKNGGACDSRNVCRCKVGTKGDYCEIVTGCEELNCDPEISHCVLKETTAKGICKCKENGKVYVDGKCVGTCEEDTDCLEGEKCKKEEGAKYCQCVRGRSGDQCSVIDDCVYGIYKNCKGDKGTCKYHEKMEKAFCECENGKVLDPTVAFCKRNCEVKDDCQHEANCVKTRGASYSFCKCKSPFEGDFCEIVKDCKLVRYANCKGENGTCVYSKEAKRAICKCGEKKELDVSVTYCKDCYCGENGKCTLRNGVKTCICNQNYIEGSDGICHAGCKSDADCKNGGTCSRNVCHCTNGTSGDDCGVISGCDKLSCERINAQCTFDILNKMATCTCSDSNRVYVNNKCMECQCGEHSTSCKFDQQAKKICECENGYSPRNGMCTDKNITDTRKELMVYSIQREYKQTEVFKIYALPS